jgi:hypothetical protein
MYPEIDIREGELYSIVELLVSTPRPRNYQNLDVLTEISQYIFDSFCESGYRPEFQDLGVDISAYRNVVCRLGPTDAPKLIVGAHYDSCADTVSSHTGLIKTGRLFSECVREVNEKFRLNCI